MKWISTVCILITVSLKIQKLESKLARELSSKSSEMLVNTIYSSSSSSNNNNNNEILEVKKSNDEKNGEEIENKKEVRGKQQKFNEDFKDVEKENKLQYQRKMKKNTKRKQLELIKKEKMVTTKTTLKAKDKSKVQFKSKELKKNSNTQRTTVNFINPFGQLSTFFGTDQLHYLQDYNFLFNAEKHTIFRLHTSLVSLLKIFQNNENNNVSNAGRVLNGVVGNSLSAALGVNMVNAAGVTTEMVQEVQLYNATSLRQSRFNPFNPTRILIHGWFGSAHANVYSALVPEYLKLENGTYNIFTIDWGRGAFADYITASYRVKPVGKVVAKFIDFLHRESGMRYEDLQLIGFSMGAHIAGIAGKFVQTGRIRIIYALDPALPLFRYENIDERIALTDADYVEVIHTSVGTYGYDQPLGHVDFYVNYGSGQPGCFLNECSHFRAFQVFAESLHNPQAFTGQGCDVQLWFDMTRNHRCLMGTGRTLTMGGNITDAEYLRKRGGGVYFLSTNGSPPYARN